MVLHAIVDEFVERYTLVLYSKSTSVYISVKMVRIDISWIVKNLHLNQSCIVNYQGQQPLVFLYIVYYIYHFITALNILQVDA